MSSLNINAANVAQYIVKFFQECEDPVTNLKLQKLLYYVQGWHLGIYNKPIFNEDFQAWVHGPVIPEIYFQYKENSWNPIVNDAGKIDLPEKIKNHVNEVLEVYGGDTGWALELRSHKEAPLLDARGNIPPDEASDKVIPKGSMQNFFSSLYNNGKD
jgi:uncharacterized phage-associated protein